MFHLLVNVCICGKTNEWKFYKKNYHGLINVRCSCHTFGCDRGDTWLDVTHAGQQGRIQMESKTVEATTMWEKLWNEHWVGLSHANWQLGVVGSDVLILPPPVLLEQTVLLVWKWEVKPSPGLDGFSYTIILMTGSRVLTKIGFPGGQGPGKGWRNLCVITFVSNSWDPPVAVSLVCIKN